MIYYAYAKNEGRLEQVIVNRFERLPNKNWGYRGYKTIRQEWTGKIYKTEEAAKQDMIKLNCKPKTPSDKLVSII